MWYGVNVILANLTYNAGYFNPSGYEVVISSEVWDLRTFKVGFVMWCAVLVIELSLMSNSSLNRSLHFINLPSNSTPQVMV